MHHPGRRVIDSLMQLFYLLGSAFAINWLFGLAVLILLQQAPPVSLFRVPAARLTAPVLGYVCLNLVWWVGTLVLRWPSSIVLTVAAVCVLVCLAILLASRRRRRVALSMAVARCDWPLLIVALSVVLVSSWSYFAAGLGNFFLVNETDFFFRVTPAILSNPLSVGILSPGMADMRSLIPIQFSTLTFLQYVFGCSSADAACIQAILDLVYTAIGVYWLSRYIFRFKRTVVALASFFGVIGQFYFHTYLDGHEGSLIYGAAVPVFISVVVFALAYDRYRTTVAVALLLYSFLASTYPQVAILLLPAFVLTKLLFFCRDKRDALRKQVSRLAAQHRRLWAVAPWTLATVSVAGAFGIYDPPARILRESDFPHFQWLSADVHRFDPQVLGMVLRASAHQGIWVWISGAGSILLDRQVRYPRVRFVVHRDSRSRCGRLALLAPARDFSSRHSFCRFR